jgi:hypothetical protein
MWISSRKDGSTVKRLIGALILSAMLVTIGIGCGGQTTSAKPATPSAPKEKEKDKPTP